MVRTITGTQAYEYFRALKNAPEEMNPVAVAVWINVFLAVGIAVIWFAVR